MSKLSSKIGFNTTDYTHICRGERKDHNALAYISVNIGANSQF